MFKKLLKKKICDWVHTYFYFVLYLLISQPLLMPSYKPPGGKKELSKRMKERERRWTTEVQRGQLQLSKEEGKYANDDSSMMVI